MRRMTECGFWGGNTLYRVKYMYLYKTHVYLLQITAPYSKTTPAGIIIFSPKKSYCSFFIQAMMFI